MRPFKPASLALASAIGACAGAGGSGLGYGLPSEADVAYSYGDTTTVSLNVMGQSMELALEGAAEYGLVFGQAAGGVEVTLTVADLDASLSMPMAAPIRLDETAVQGALVFSLDRRGNATVLSTPEVSQEASRMISGLGTAHTFLPGLPGTAVAAGDQWVDTVSYEGEAELGATTEMTILRYTVVGDTAVDGRSLLKIALEGTTELSSSMDMQGMRVAQTSTVDVEGWVLWDSRAGLMFEMVKNGSGEGSVAVPIAPQPLPISVSITQRTRLLDRRGAGG